jgi:DNA polymerase-1
LSKRILIIDQLNMFFRAYIVDPSLSENGQPIGGLKGTLKIMQKLLRETKPDRVVICWDGAGGSKKRRSLNKDYKGNRRPIRLNREVRNLSESEEIQNKIWQQTRLIDYFNHMPVSQIMLPDIEADDTIAYACQLPGLKGEQKLIVSSDKDFFQLLDDETVLYRPIQKEFLNKNSIIDKFGIHPNNMTIARAMAGDKSDNLEGIGGCGLTTVSKRFPFLKEEKSYTITEVLQHSKEMLSERKLKVYENLLNKQETFERNYKIMQLYAPSISVTGKHTIRDSVLNSDLSLNKTAIRKMMIEDGFVDYNWSSLFQSLNRVCFTE